jgi:hypothetical protein
VFFSRLFFLTFFFLSLFRTHTGRVGKNYLQLVLKDVVTDLLHDKNLSLEVDPGKLGGKNGASSATAAAPAPGTAADTDQAHSEGADIPPMTPEIAAAVEKNQ